MCKVNNVKVYCIFSMTIQMHKRKANQRLYG